MIENIRLASNATSQAARVMNSAVASP